MEGSHQCTLELHGAGVQGGLAGREEDGLTSALLSDDLHLQVLHDFAMFPLEQLGQGGPPDLGIPDGHRSIRFHLLDGTGLGHLSFFDHC